MVIFFSSLPRVTYSCVGEVRNTGRGGSKKYEKIKIEVKGCHVVMRVLEEHKKKMKEKRRHNKIIYMKNEIRRANEVIL